MAKCRCWYMGKLTIVLEDELEAQLRALQYRKGSLSYHVNRALEQYFRARKEK